MLVLRFILVHKCIIFAFCPLNINILFKLKICKNRCFFRKSSTFMMLTMQPLPQMLHIYIVQSESGSHLKAGSEFCIRLSNICKQPSNNSPKAKAITKKKISNLRRLRDTCCFIVWSVIAQTLQSALRFCQTSSLCWVSCCNFSM